MTDNMINLPRILRLSGSALKVIAVLSMVIDHLALYFMESGTPVYEVMRSMGRIAFPVFAFLIAEGYTYSKDRTWYFIKLLGFAFISEMQWYLLNGADGTHNVMFTLALGALAIGVFDKLKERKPFCICMILFVMAYAYWIGADYEWRGILMIILFYMLRQNRAAQLLLAFPLMMHYGTTGALLACAVLFLYDGTRGFAKGWIARLGFYLFYPIHLLVIWTLLGIK